MKARAAAEPAPRLLTTSEVGRMTGMDPRSVCRALSAGWIEAIKTPGGQWRIPADAVERHLREGAP